MQPYWEAIFRCRAMDDESYSLYPVGNYITVCGEFALSLYFTEQFEQGILSPILELSFSTNCSNKMAAVTLKIVVSLARHP